MTDQLEEIRSRRSATTAAPWGWRGYVDGSIELRALHSMGRRILTSVRSEPCLIELLSGDDCEFGDWVLTADACDGCRAEAAKTQDPWLDYRCPKEANLDTLWLCAPDGSFIRPANTWAVRERPYRGDVVAVDHPDAAFIAQAPVDVDWLIAEFDRLRRSLDYYAQTRATGCDR